MIRITTAVGALLLGAVALQVSADDTHAGMAHGVASAADAPASTRAFAEASARMHEAMAIPYTGDADVDFMAGMIPHHQGAIDMARIVLEHGTDPEARALAEAIIAAQTAEIAQIEAWLAKRGR